jgi:hypothetical protein
MMNKEVEMFVEESDAKARDYHKLVFHRFKGKSSGLKSEAKFYKH